MADRDLVAALRALDAELGARPPHPRLRARLRASLAARSRSRWWPPGGEVARLGWPFGLAAATAALLLVAGRPRHGGERPVADGEPGEIVREKVDAGPAERSLLRA